MKEKINKSINIILIFYLFFHLCYGIFMMIDSMLYGLVWLLIFLIELVPIIIGKRKMKIILPLIAICCLLQSCLSIGIIFLGNDSDTAGADTVLVLGYQLKENRMTKTLEYRLDEAYKYAVDNPSSQLILCGGITRENTISEAEVMKNYLINKGISEKRLTCEEQSTDTIENIQNSLAYINPSSKIIVLSSNYHVFRAKIICEKAGLNVKGIGSKAPLVLIPNQCLFEKLGLIKRLLN